MTIDFRFSPRANKAANVNWRAWSPETFEEAKRADKPILLSISAVWCHWCHVMDETSYSDESAISLINEKYIPIRVDNDRRPDINQRYNMGGWPSTVFLTPEGHVLTGGTYIAPEQFKELLNNVEHVYKTEKQAIYKHIVEAESEAATDASSPPGEAPLTKGIVDEIAQTVTGRVDPLYGGFGREPKFPHTDAIQVLLHKYESSGEEYFLKMARLTLDHMASGGVFDQVEGGFFRYSTTRDWTVPHYEKMLEDNAGLLKNYLYAYLITGEFKYQSIAERIVTYVNLNLYDLDTGAFFGSQDADEHYYTLDGASRKPLPKPPVDRTIYTNWNASMASAYLYAGWVLDRPECQSQGIRAVDFIWNTCFIKGQGLMHYYDGKPSGTGMTNDYSMTIRALLDAYETTRELEYIERARTLAAILKERFYDAKSGAFCDIVEQGSSALGSLKHRNKPLADNVNAAEALLRLAHHTADDSYSALAYSALKFFSQDYAQYQEFASGYAIAVAHLLSPALEITLAADQYSPKLKEFLQESMSVRYPHKLMQVINSKDKHRMDFMGFGMKPGPTAYICYNKICTPPIDDIAGIKRAVKEFVQS